MSIHTCSLPVSDWTLVWCRCGP